MGLKYSGINYERCHDSFEKIKHVKSYMLYKSQIFTGGEEDFLITILIPVYKRVELLKETLDSITFQDHVDFLWDILIIDNEPYDGIQNATEKLIRTYDNINITYYRNEKNIGVAGNYNRGIDLAYGKYISMVHADDLIIRNYLLIIGQKIKKYETRRFKPLGYISCPHQWFMSPSIGSSCETRKWLLEMENYYCLSAINAKMVRIRQLNVPLMGNVGTFLPSCGTIINRSVAIELGGYDEELGISTDMFLPYSMMRRYSVYRINKIMGFYRWSQGDTTSSDKKNNVRIASCLFDFREYVYRKNILYFILGSLFRSEHFYYEVQGLLTSSFYSRESENFEDFFPILDYKNHLVRRIVFKLILKLNPLPDVLAPRYSHKSCNYSIIPLF